MNHPDLSLRSIGVQGSPDPEKHLAARFFYPCAPEQSGSNKKKARKTRYLPERKYAEGLGKYVTSDTTGKWCACSGLPTRA